MADTITLQAYLDELNRLLDRESLAEVISHCRYILQHYPQNVETYRILAKALLQKGNNESLDEHYTEAAEVFRRVLSVVPNDYVAHLGMSEIREHENTLDQAIWHMERAYEQLPGNQMLQQALRALYAKRDGEQRAPEKIQLTRAALARQYINGQLFDQALIELRTALQQNPDRPDLLVLLADTLWESQHPIEAAETAIQILKKLPYCLPANRTMARLWLENERPTDAQSFLDRIEAVDPYAAAAILGTEAEASRAVMITRLDYGSRAQASLTAETPDWVQELGDLSDNSAAANLFQGMSAGSTAPERSNVFADSPEMFADWASPADSSPTDVPDWFSEIGAGPATTAPAAPAADVPDWFADVVSESAAADQSPAPMDWLLDEEPPAPAAAVAPDWLSDDNLPSFEELVGAPAETPAASPADWLDDLPGSPPESAPPAAAEAVDLGADFFDFDSLDLGSSEPAPASGFTDLLAEIETTQRPAEPADAAREEALLPPDWLAGFEEEPPAPAGMSTDDRFSEPEAASPADDVAFLASFDEPVMETPDAGSTAPEPLEWSTLEQDQFMQDLFTASSDAPDEAPSAEIATPEWLPPAAPSGETAATAQENESWLSALDDASDMWDTALETEQASGAPPSTTAPATELDTAEDDWLTSAGSLRDAESPSALDDAGQPVMGGEEPAAEIEPAADLPDWVRSAAPVPPTPEPAVEVPGPLPVGEDLMAMFETAEPAADSWDQLPVTEAQVEQELDWLRPPVEEGDWLGSFAKEEMTGESEEEIDLGSRLDAMLGTPATANDDEWLMIGEQEFVLEEVSEPPAAQEPVLEVPLAEPEEAPVEEEPAEPVGPPEVGEQAPRWGSSKLLAGLDSKSSDAQDSPAWLADMEPVKSASEEAVGALQESYDPFEGGSPENVPQYGSARETGILQPDEEPAWMGAFTGAEVPEERVEESQSLPSREEPAPEMAAPDEEGEIEFGQVESAPADSDTFSALGLDNVFAGDFETGASEDTAPAQEGAVPDWLAAITSSETGNFPDLAFDDPGTYSQDGEEHGVLQPDSESAWLTGMRNSVDDSDLDFPMEEDVLYGLRLAERDQDVDEVAPEHDLADTSLSDELDLDADDENVPDDFSFEAMQPLWMRQPNGDFEDEDEQQNVIPDWLFDSFNEDENL